MGVALEEGDTTDSLVIAHELLTAVLLDNSKSRHPLMSRCMDKCCRSLSETIVWCVQTLFSEPIYMSPILKTVGARASLVLISENSPGGGCAAT